MASKRVMLRTVDRLLWYVFSVGHGQDAFAQSQIRQAGYETYMPLLMKKNSNRTVSVLPLLPGYLFVRMNITELKWRALLVLQGVTGILGRPTHVATKDIRKLRSAAKLEKDVLVIKPGDLVEICDGSANEGFQASVSAIDGGRARVSIMLFGKLIEHTFKLDEVRKV